MALINGSPGNDSVRFGGRDLIGTNRDDAIFGLAGNDLLNGGTGGNDLLDGGAGDDNLSAAGNGIHFLNGGAGNDTLFVANFSGLGSVLDGGDGDDTLSAEDADDMLVGGAGNDILIGGFGRDTLIGEAGNDMYVLISEANVSVDTVIETIDGGIDTIDAGINITLPDNIENLVLSDAVLGTGNELNNTITAANSDSSNNIFSGLRGNDSLSSGAGNDILIGGAGDDSLTGGTGTDRLVGGAGGDRFRFLAPNEGIDIIADFGVGNDSIRVSATGFGGGLVARAAISADQFHIGSVAADANDRFIYNRRGELFFDVDGVGRVAPIQIATVGGAPTLSAANIVVF